MNEKVINAVTDFLQSPEQWACSLDGTGPVHDVEELYKEESGGHVYALATTSATTALQLCFEATGLQGKKVIVPALTYGATVAAVLRTGNTPVFCDIDAASLTLDPDAVYDLLKEHDIAAILAVSYLGYPNAAVDLRALATEFGCYYFDDSAGALGSRYHGKNAGFFSDAVCFSGSWGKPAFAGELGCICTSSERIYRTAIEISQHPARISRDCMWAKNSLGYNFRVNPISATIAAVNFDQALEMVRCRRDAWRFVLAGLSALGLSKTPLPPKGIEPTWTRFTFLPAKSKAEIERALPELGLPYRLGSSSSLDEPVYLSDYFTTNFQNGRQFCCPVGEHHYTHRLSLLNK